MFKLETVYLGGKRPVVTAHRGFSGKYPENTLPAFKAAYRLGVDIIEFDVRESIDSELLIMHDSSIDRTTNGSGEINKLKFKDLRLVNASYWQGTHDRGKRLEKPAYENLQIPTFREILEFCAGKDLGINIQVYVDSPAALKKICSLYAEFDLYQKAFLMIATFKQAQAVKEINPRIEICVGEERDNLKRHKEFGSKIIQPWKAFVTPEFCCEIADIGLWANMFFSNTPEENEKYLSYGLQGIMTDLPDLLLKQ
ncbi:MAG: glycerophosphodiester phosphodiesterase family protein [Lentisphaeria bacterium]